MILALIVIAATLTFLALIQNLNFRYPWWVGAPLTMGAYGIFHQLYDHILWQLHAGPIALSQIPDVSGVWVGMLTSSYNSGTEINVVFYIRQTWSKIAIRIETAHSTSSTIMVALSSKDTSVPNLYYECISEPGANASPLLQIHHDIGHLSLSSDGKTFAGEYYAGRDGIIHGTFYTLLQKKAYHT